LREAKLDLDVLTGEFLELHHGIFDRPLTIDDREYEMFYFRIFNYDSMLTPPGKTVVQVILRTDFD